MTNAKDTVAVPHEEPHTVFPDIPNACRRCGSMWVVPCEEIWMYECLDCDDGPRHVQPEDPYV